MKAYRLKKGRHHRVLRGGTMTKLSGGDIVELTDLQALSFGDKFEPVEVTKTVVEPVSDPEPDPEPGPWHEIAEMNTAEVQELIEEIDTVDDLTALGDAEAVGKNRKGVFAAIAARIEEIEELEGES